MAKQKKMPKYTVGSRWQLRTIENEIFSVGLEKKQNRIGLIFPGKSVPVWIARPIVSSMDHDEEDGYILPDYEDYDFPSRICEAIAKTGKMGSNYYIFEGCVDQAHLDELKLFDVTIVDFNGFTLKGNVVAIYATGNKGKVGVSVATVATEIPYMIGGRYRSPLLGM